MASPTDSRALILTPNDEVQRLQGENADLRSRLDAAAAKIMSLQGLTDQITDAAVSRTLDSLYSDIEAWVSTIDQGLKAAGLDFNDRFRRAFESGSDAITSFAMRDNDSQAWLATWLRDPRSESTCIYLVLSRQIWTFLEDSVFHRPFPLGMPRLLGDAFKEIISVMQNEPGKQDSNLNAQKWRSLTVRSLSSTTTFQKCYENEVKELWRKLISHLEAFVHEKILHGHRDSLNDLISRATRLHLEMTCSSYEYILVTPAVELFNDQRLIHGMDLPAMQLRDINTWRPPYHQTPIPCLCLYPGIRRKGISGENDVQVMVPHVLVHELERQNSPSYPPERSYVSVKPQGGMRTESISSSLPGDVFRQASSPVPRHRRLSQSENEVPPASITSQHGDGRHHNRRKSQGSRPTSTPVSPLKRAIGSFPTLSMLSVKDRTSSKPKPEGLSRGYLGHRTPRTRPMRGDLSHEPRERDDIQNRSPLLPTEKKKLEVSKEEDPGAEVSTPAQSPEPPTGKSSEGKGNETGIEVEVDESGIARQRPLKPIESDWSLEQTNK